ncbi:MAG: c-type cytochrome biogenesis protein CcmI [Candidatus Marinimicrobia bacterium]|nr:c-type cytochrome biogenesis protein CcmI [Candidatus Neomarinimicrobiota bacterium]
MIWVVFGSLVLAVIAALLWPLVRAPRFTESRTAYDFMVFQDQLKEVERDKDRGLLTTIEADAARLEIHRRILATSKIEVPEPTTGSFASRGILSVGIFALIPLLALVVYLPIGSPMVPGMSADERTQIMATASEQTNQLLEQIAANVAANPDNTEGWSLLARSFRQLRRYDESAAAYRELARLAPSGEVYANLGEVLAAARGGVISREVHDVLMQALAIDRDEPRARFYLGLEQSQLGNKEVAIAIWRNLAADATDSTPWLDLVINEISRAAEASNLIPINVEPKHPLDLSVENPATQTPVAAGRIMPENMDMIQGMVDGLAARLESDPEDFDGWMMLGRSYTVLGNFDGALNAYRKAMTLKPADINSRLQFAAVMISRTDLNALGPLPESLTQTMAEVLKIDTKQPNALFITGLAHAKSGNLADAKTYWQRALAELPNSTPLKSEIKRRLNTLD